MENWEVVLCDSDPCPVLVFKYTIEVAGTIELFSMWLGSGMGLLFVFV